MRTAVNASEYINFLILKLLIPAYFHFCNKIDDTLKIIFL